MNAFTTCLGLLLCAACSGYINEANSQIGSSNVEKASVALQGQTAEGLAPLGPQHGGDEFVDQDGRWSDAFTAAEVAKIDTYCERGIKGAGDNSTVCCHKYCGSCVSKGCSSRKPGPTYCCPSVIKESGRSCSKTVAPCMMFQ